MRWPVRVGKLSSSNFHDIKVKKNVEIVKLHTGHIFYVDYFYYFHVVILFTTSPGEDPY